MKTELYTIKNKIPELSYAFTLNGIELPVLDITHPYFIASTDEDKLKKMLPYVEKNAERNAEEFNKMPSFIKNFLSQRSFAMAELLQGEKGDTFATGIKAALKISTAIKPRFLGLKGLKSIIEPDQWKLDNIKEGNPRYLVFTIKKEMQKNSTLP